MPSVHSRFKTLSDTPFLLIITCATSCWPYRFPMSNQSLKKFRSPRCFLHLSCETTILLKGKFNCYLAKTDVSVDIAKIIANLRVRAASLRNALRRHVRSLHPANISHQVSCLSSATGFLDAQALPIRFPNWFTEECFSGAGCSGWGGAGAGAGACCCICCGGWFCCIVHACIWHCSQTMQKATCIAFTVWR